MSEDESKINPEIEQARGSIRNYLEELRDTKDRITNELATASGRITESTQSMQTRLQWIEKKISTGTSLLFKLNVTVEELRAFLEEPEPKS